LSTSSTVIALGSSSSTSGSAPFFAFSPLFFPPIPPLALNRLSSPLPSSSHPYSRPVSRVFCCGRAHDTPYARTTSVYRDVSSRILHSNFKSVVRSKQKEKDAQKSEEAPWLTLTPSHAHPAPSSTPHTTWVSRTDSHSTSGAFVVYLPVPILAALRPSPRHLVVSIKPHLFIHSALSTFYGSGWGVEIVDQSYRAWGSGSVENVGR
jgi:hypothetical protein